MALSAKDLRIGNLVKSNNPKHHPRILGEILVVTGIYPTTGFENEKAHGVNLEHVNQKPNTYYESYSQFIKFIEPIQLTEEILLKFDFDKIENGTYLNKFYVTIVSGYFVFWITDIYSVAIKYVHELQNLYFALTGEELEINL